MRQLAGFREGFRRFGRAGRQSRLRDLVPIAVRANLKSPI